VFLDRPLEKIEERHESESEAEDVKQEEVTELEKIEENQEEEQQSVQSVETKTEEVKGERGASKAGFKILFLVLKISVFINQGFSQLIIHGQKVESLIYNYILYCIPLL
jgi:hypothetical protein